MATEKIQTLSKMRETILNDTLQKDGKNRFGLFSCPPAGVWGDGDYNNTKQKKLGPDGRVATAPRKIYTGPSSSGKVASSFFSKTSYTTIGDPYRDQASIERQYQISRKKKFPHEADFKPADGTKSDPFKAIFKHEPEFTNEKKNYRGPDGKVIAGPRNITVVPPKSGHLSTTIGHLFSKPTPHMKDEYSRQRELEYKERQEEKKKLQENPFRSTDHGGRPFSNNKKTFGLEKPLPQPRPKSVAPPPMISEYPFKPANPAKKGYNKTISKFPEYKPDPMRIVTRKKEDTKKESFKPNNTADYIRPTPSISLNKANLKSELSAISAKLF